MFVTFATRLGPDRRTALMLVSLKLCNFEAAGEGGLAAALKDCCGGIVVVGDL